jgi:hypothetical protein
VRLGGREVSRPGYGARVRVVSSTSGREWLGEVLVWGPRGEPYLRDAHTAEVRWFPASWVDSVTDPGPGPGPCSCTADPDSGETPRSPACPVHGDQAAIAAAIIKKARSRD